MDGSSYAFLNLLFVVSLDENRIQLPRILILVHQRHKAQLLTCIHRYFM
jgi:hypothetical protein